MSKKQTISVFWYRRDLRLQDNTALFHAHLSEFPVLPIFIFDTGILSSLERDDARISFIHTQLENLQKYFVSFDSQISCFQGNVLDVWKGIIESFDVREVYFNRDYEPYAIRRDKEVMGLLENNGIRICSFKDQVIHEKDEVLKEDKTPYTVYTPYKKKWLSQFSELKVHKLENVEKRYVKSENSLLSLERIGFEKSSIQVPDADFSVLELYEEKRAFPYINTSYLGAHLRFGTIGIRELIMRTKTYSVFLSELIWREFFMQILYHFPHVAHSSFRPAYDGLPWNNDDADFEKWCAGQTGYPMVDAGMRELNQTGLMHNRVRMVCASFLCKHLLIDWRWGEMYFAKKLLDFELASNNGNWQWAAGTGCDAAPYFRVFNPTTQLQKFDPKRLYTKKWVPELGSLSYPKEMVEHKFARDRAIETYKNHLSKSQS